MTVSIIYGPMFAGKSKTLICRARKYELKRGKNSLLMIKYSKDTRYLEGENIYVVSHDQEIYPALPVNTLGDIPNEDLKQYKKIFVDEGQFFTDLLEFIKRVRSLGIDLCISGLNLNHKRENFGQMHEAMEMSDKTIKLQAVCSDCKGNADYTRMNSQSETLRDAVIVIGGAELYSPVCESCYTVSL